MIKTMPIEKIEVYTEVNQNNVVVSEHAIDQALDRFNLKNTTRTKVSEWVRSKYNHSAFKSTVTGDRYGIARLFVNNDIGIVLDIHREVILTVYPIEIRRNVKTKIERYLSNEIKRVTKAFSERERKYRRMTVKLNLEKAQIEHDLLYIRKDCKRNSLIARVNAINISVNEMVKELYDLQLEKEELEISLSSQALRNNQ